MLAFLYLNALRLLYCGVFKIILEETMRQHENLIPEDSKIDLIDLKID